MRNNNRRNNRRNLYTGNAKRPINTYLTQETRPRVLSQKDLYRIFPFGKTKMKKLLQSGELPTLKIGNDYITTYHIVEKWIEKHLGEEIYF